MTTKKPVGHAPTSDFTSSSPTSKTLLPTKSTPGQAAPSEADPGMGANQCAPEGAELFQKPSNLPVGGMTKEVVSSPSYFGTPVSRSGAQQAAERRRGSGRRQVTFPLLEAESEKEASEMSDVGDTTPPEFSGICDGNEEALPLSQDFPAEPFSRLGHASVTNVAFDGGEEAVDETSPSVANEARELSFAKLKRAEDTRESNRPPDFELLSILKCVPQILQRSPAKAELTPLAIEMLEKFLSLDQELDTSTMHHIYYIIKGRLDPTFEMKDRASLAAFEFGCLQRFFPNRPAQNSEVKEAAKRVRAILGLMLVLLELGTGVESYPLPDDAMADIASLLTSLLKTNTYFQFCSLLPQREASELNQIMADLHRGLISTHCRTWLSHEEHHSPNLVSSDLSPTFIALCKYTGNYPAIGSFEYSHPLELFNHQFLDQLTEFPGVATEHLREEKQRRQLLIGYLYWRNGHFAKDSDFDKQYSRRNSEAWATVKGQARAGDLSQELEEFAYKMEMGLVPTRDLKAISARHSLRTKLIGTKRARMDDESSCFEGGDFEEEILNPETMEEKRLQIEKDGEYARQLQYGRPRRTPKPITPFDNSQIKKPDVTPRPKPTATKSSAKRGSERSGKRAGEGNGTRAARGNRSGEAADPFSRASYKQLIEPLYLIDKLEVLRKDKLPFDFLLKQKDLKAMRSKVTSKERVILVPNRDSLDPGSFDICINLNAGREESPLPESPLDYSNRKSMEQPRQTDSDSVSVVSNGEALNGSLDLNITKSSNLERHSDLSLSRRVDSFWKKQEDSLLAVMPWDQRHRLRGIGVEENWDLLNQYHHCSWLDNTEENRRLMQSIKSHIQQKRSEAKSSTIITIPKENLDMTELNTPEKTIPKEEPLVGHTQGEPQHPNLIPIGAESSEADRLLKLFLEPDTPIPPYVPPEEENPGEFKLQRDLTCLEDITHRFDYAYYHNLDFLMNDLTVIVVKAMRERCHNKLAFAYLSWVLLQFSAHVRSKREAFNQKWLDFYEPKMKANQHNNHPMVGKGNPKVWYSKFDKTDRREYIDIDDFKPKLPDETDHLFPKDHGKILKSDATPEGLSTPQREELAEIQQTLLTMKKSKCSGGCCTGEESLKKEREIKAALVDDMFKKSECPCIRVKTECSDECGCTVESCRNRQIQKKKSLKLGVDVEERVTWGMDMCTAVNFLSLLPRATPRRIIRDWIEKKLMYAVQQQGEDGYDVLRALDFIITLPRSSPYNEVISIDGKQSFRYEQEDKEVAQIIKDGILNFPEKNAVHFKIHTKGLGIFCTRSEGIDQNSLVVEYLGEMYTQHHWYEKQDVIKQGQHEGKLNKDLPDFYNIILERHMDDPDGYKLLTVDPILYGNFASRLSHSCMPNCQTLTKVLKGRYTIGMFTTAPIAFGEELCFDYCSSTESEKEFEDAVCLCCTVNCKGKFLTLTNEKKQLAMLKQFHTFIDRNFVIYNAITDSKLSPVNKRTLEHNGLRSLMTNRIPLWLQKWAALICEYIEFEQIQSYMEQMDQPDAIKAQVKLDASLQKDVQIQNISITIDKVANVLRKMNKSTPPILKLSEAEIFRRSWVVQHSTMEELQMILQIMEKGPFSDACVRFIEDVKQEQLNYEGRDITEDQAALMNGRFREAITKIAILLRRSKSEKVFIEPLSDMLQMIGSTKTYFTTNESYTKVKSCKVKVRQCDVKQEQNTGMDSISQGHSVLNGFKEYDSQYIWGQLVCWYKQTVGKPNASLSADRRGTLSIPDLNSFIVGGADPNRKTSKRPKKEKHQEDFIEFPTSGRGKGQNSCRISLGMDGSLKEEDAQMEPVSKNPAMPKPISMQVHYPSKRNISRKEFLSTWHLSFSKQWDVNCGWHFKNVQKMYGTIQFESLLMARAALEEKYAVEMSQWERLPYDLMKVERYKLIKEFMATRLTYFNQVVKEMLKEDE